MTKVYGVDVSKPVSPIMVRDAIIDCFHKAHTEVLDEMDSFAEWKKDSDRDEFRKIEVELLVKKFFEDTGGNFDNPKKEDLTRVCDKLAKYAINFRKPKIVKKHFKEILTLVNAID